MALPEVEVLIVGSGAGGGIAAWVLAEAGFRVTVLEKGPWLTETAFSNDDVKFGYRDFYTQDVLIEPRTFRQTDQQPAQVNHVSPLSIVFCSASSFMYASVRISPVFASRMIAGVNCIGPESLLELEIVSKRRSTAAAREKAKPPERHARRRFRWHRENLRGSRRRPTRSVQS